MKFATKSFIAVAALAASSATMADSRFYGFLDLGQAAVRSSIDYNELQNGSVYAGDFSLKKKNNMQYTLGAGVTFADYFAFELSHSDFGDIHNLSLPDCNSCMPTTVNATNTATNISDIQTVDFNLVASTSVGKDFSVYAKAGYEYFDARVSAYHAATLAAGSVPAFPAAAGSESANGWGYDYGFGFKLDMTEKLSLRNEYMWHHLNDHLIDVNIQTISLGLVYSF